MTTVGGTGGRARAGPDGRTDPNRSWTLWFERSLGFVFAIVVVNDIVVSADYIRATVDATAPAGRVAVLAGTAALIGAAAVISTGRRIPWLAYWTVGILLAAQVVTLAAVVHPDRMPAVWWAWQLMVPAFVLAAALLPMRRACALTAAAVAGYLAVRLSPASGAAAGWVSAVSEAMLASVFIALTAVFVPAWRRTAAIADDAAGAQRRAFAEAEAARAVERQERAASRLLHDEVIHALRAVALPTGAIEQSRIRAMAAHAAELLRRAAAVTTPERRDLIDELRALAHRPGRPIDLRVDGHGHLPDRVVGALVGAVGEALRNAELHAGCRTLTIEVAQDDDGAVVRVIDDGRGFDPGTVASGPMGFRQSIVGRVVDVGGRASVTSAPGAGTTVELRWRVPTPDGVPSHRLADLAGTRTRLVLGATMPILGFVVIQAGLHRSMLTDPRPALAAVAITAALTVAAARRAGRHPMTGAQSAVLITAAMLTPIAGGLGLVAGGDVAIAYFAAGAGASGLALIAMFRPPWESIAGAVAATAVTIGMLLRLAPDGAMMWPGMPAIAANLVGVACLLGGRLTIDRMATSIRRSEELERHSQAAAVQVRVARDVLGARLVRVRAWVLPFLTGVQNGGFALGSAAVRREAVTLEAAVRDDIRLGTQIDPRCRELIARARRAGRTVEVIADADGPPALPAGLVGRLLAAALDGDPIPARTVLTVSAARSRRVSLMVGPAPDRPTLVRVAEQLGASVRHGPDFLLVRYVLRDNEPGMSPHVGTIAPAPAGIGSAAMSEASRAHDRDGQAGASFGAAELARRPGGAAA